MYFFFAEDEYRTVTAIGYDEVVLDQLMERIVRDEYRVQTIVTEVTTSYLFTHRRVNK